MENKKGNRFVDRTGEIFQTKEGYSVQLIEYNSAKDCSFKFLIDKEVICRNVWFKGIREGTVKNPYHPTVFKKGFIGFGKYNCKGLGGKITKTYNTWNGVLERCYCEKFSKRVSTYKDVTVCEEWHNFQVFAEWFEENYNPEVMQGWQLDKDILLKGNKVYSPDTCCFVPQEINSIFKSSKSYRGEYPIGVTECCGNFRTGLNKGNTHIHLGTFKTIEEAFQAYKTAKEDYIKEVADKWKDKIDPRVYETIYNYKVEITD